MAIEQQITLNSEKGVRVITTRSKNIHEAIESAQLTSRIAPAIRLIHQLAKDPRRDEFTPTIPFQGAELVFVCACGHQAYSRDLAIQQAHVVTLLTE